MLENGHLYLLYNLDLKLLLPLPYIPLCKSLLLTYFITIGVLVVWGTASGEICIFIGFPDISGRESIMLNVVLSECINHLMYLCIKDFLELQDTEVSLG